MHIFIFFFFNDTATTEIYTLSLHDALPISKWPRYALIFDTETRITADQSLTFGVFRLCELKDGKYRVMKEGLLDRKSTRLNSSHLVISYAVFCLKKKKHVKSTLPCSRCTSC